MTSSSDITVIAFVSGVSTFGGIAFIEAYLSTFIDICNGFEESTNNGVTVAFYGLSFPHYYRTLVTRT